LHGATTMKLRPLVAVGCLLVAPSMARAESPPPPWACRQEAQVYPPAGTTIPANTPALYFAPSWRSSSVPNVAEHDLQLRESGAADPVPIVLERVSGGYLTGLARGSSEDRLVKPQRELRVGEVTLSFLETCGPPAPPSDAGPWPRNGKFRYQVVAAVPFPTSAGTARVRSVEILEKSDCQGRVIWVDVDLAADLAAFPLLDMSAETAGGRPLTGSFWRSGARIQGNFYAACGPTARPGDLMPGTTVVRLLSEIAGGPKLAPLMLTVNVDCGADAGVCPMSQAVDAAQREDTAGPVDGSGSVIVAPRLDASPGAPDAPAVADGSPTLAPGGGGCGCATGGPGPAPPLVLVLAGLGWRLRRRLIRAPARRR
jgi:uncharacterized protein (TIGR03382 family)